MKTVNPGCERPTPRVVGARLENVVPVAVVIAAGCEPCAEKMVARALEGGSSAREVERTLRVIADLRARECFAEAVGEEVVARMERPLAAARKVLERAPALAT